MVYQGGRTPQLDELAQECGRLYSQVVVSFWRTVRHKGIWLKPSRLMRLYTSPKLHAHTADACVQAFFAGLKSWRERKKAGDPDVKPPHKRKRYFRIEYKRSAMALKDGVLRLSNGKGNAPLVLSWPSYLPNTVVIHWTGTQYEAIATYEEDIQGQPQGEKIAGIDLGEVHLAVCHDGTQTHILNGRLLRAKVQYRNKLQATLNPCIDGKRKPTPAVPARSACMCGARCRGASFAARTNGTAGPITATAWERSTSDESIWVTAQ